MQVDSSSGQKLNNVIDTKVRWFSKRYLLAVTLFFGSFALYSFPANTSLMLIDMTKNRTITINKTVVYLEPEFNWNSKIKGLILSISSYGRLLSPIAALVIRKLGGVRTYGLGLLLCGIINILHPFSVRLNFYLFLVIKSMEGLIDITVYISTFEIWSQWAPEGERSKLMAIGFTGLYVGTAVIFPLSGFLAHTWQWPSTFFFVGGIAVFISLIVLSMFSNEPATDKYISEKERKYILQEVKRSPQKLVTYPLKQILTSKPVWALIMGKFCFTCGYTFINMCLPHYIKDMTDLEIQDVGAISGIPNMASIVTIPLAGCLADYLQNKNILNATQVHKMYIFIGLVLAGVCLFVVAVQENFTINIIILIFFKMLLSMSYLAQLLIPLYMAPNHASLVVSIISYGIVAAGAFTPLLMGYVVTTHDPLEWRIFLVSLGLISLAGGIIFILFGSSETQPWSRTKTARNAQEPTVEIFTKRL